MRLVWTSLLPLIVLSACDHAAPPPVETPPAIPLSAASESAAPPVAEAPAPDAPRGKRAPCTTDQSCNGEPTVSALWGKCSKDTGVCECNAGFELHPGGSCYPAKK